MAAYAASLELDRSRPLWEMQIVHGLPKGRVALIAKVHHAAVDGLSGAEVLTVLLDMAPEGREIPPATPRVVEQPPHELALLGRSLVRMPLHPWRGLRALPSVLPGLTQVPPLRGLPGVGQVARLSSRVTQLAGRVAGNEDGGVLEMPSIRAPRTRLNGQVSPHRRFAFGTLSLDTVKKIKNAHGVTVNDVVMTLCAGALRRRLSATGDLPEAPLVALVPLSVRTPEQFGTYGNKISMMIVPIPTNIADPVERLATMHETMSSAKERHQALPATLLQDVTHFIPPALFARTTRTLFRVAAQNPIAPAVNVVISNVPGAPFPLFCGGAKMENNYPVSVLFEGVGLNITVLSYQSHLDFGLIADRDMLPDTWDLLADLRKTLKELAR
jgi:WS/DGAT/MGAT family acyltransferase